MKIFSSRTGRVKPVLFTLSGLLCLVVFLSAGMPRKEKKPLRFLLVTGGCCHNYAFQTEAIKGCLPSSFRVAWTVVNEGGTGTTATIPLYDREDWAKGFDLVIHNECFADTKDSLYVKR